MLDSDMGRLVITVGALAKGVEALSKATTALKSAKIAGNLSNVISAITESKAGNKAAESALVFMKKSAGTAAKALGIVGAIFAGIDLAVKEQLIPSRDAALMQIPAPLRWICIIGIGTALNAIAPTIYAFLFDSHGGSYLYGIVAAMTCLILSCIFCWIALGMTKGKWDLV